MEIQSLPSDYQDLDTQQISVPETEEPKNDTPPQVTNDVEHVLDIYI